MRDGMEVSGGIECVNCHILSHGLFWVQFQVGLVSVECCVTTLVVKHKMNPGDTAKAAAFAPKETAGWRNGDF